MSDWLVSVLLNGEDETTPAPPGSGPTQKFDGPWFSTQLVLSLFIGLTSFLLFCLLRTRWEIVYMGRTKLKDFSPTPAHSPDAQSASTSSRFFGWILPTLRTSEFTVLQTVGLDAAVLLNFYRMAFLLFSLAAFLATIVLMPLNLFRHGSTDVPADSPINDTLAFPELLSASLSTIVVNGTTPITRPSLYDILLDPTTSSTIHLIFTYLFTFLCLYFFHQNFHRFVLSRQSFGLHLIHSISARTVLVSGVPNHLRGDRALADYFEGCGWAVESVSVSREVEPLRKVLEKRTDALLKLEAAWADWVGNPASAAIEGYNSQIYTKSTSRTITSSPQQNEALLIPDLDDDESQPSGSATPSHSHSHSQANGSSSTERDLEICSSEIQHHSHVHIHTTRPRPTLRPRWFGAKVDAIEYWEKKFHFADEQVRELRKSGMFEATHAAFVTFENVKDAQIACQVVHFPHHSEVATELAPEPRDVVWSKVSMSSRQAQVRDVLIAAVMGLLFLFWIVPVSSLAALLSYAQIKKVAPGLAKLIDASPRLAAIVQNSLPSLALITFNALLPFILEWLSYMQGFKSRSATEYSLLKKYYLFLLISVLFIFLLTSTYLALVRDLVDTPAKIPQKLASALQGANVRNFMVSYVMLQALGLMPLQLLNLGPLVSLGSARALFTKTPRDYAEANAPPILNYGWVYPQALLVFTITLVYSVMSPLILVFGATYFGVAYLVYKYKLLFIYFKPYESNGEAWRITFARTLWALILFQLFMTGLFSLRQYFWATAAMAPLILYTLWWSWVMWRDFGPLSKYLAISSVCEVQRGEGVEGVVGTGDEGNVSRSQSNLNHRRYAVNDETLYVAPSDKRTDYSQPPMNNFYYGVLNTGRRRYAHPALSGLLPTPWLPAKTKFGDGAKHKKRSGVVLSLRRKVAKRLRKEYSNSNGDNNGNDEGENEEGGGLPEGWTTGQSFTDVAAATSSANADSNTGSYLGVGVGAGDRLSRASSSGSNPWGEPTPTPTSGGGNGNVSAGGSGLRKKISFDPGSGVIALPDEGNVWGDDDDDEDEDEDDSMAASPSTYYPKRDRARTLSSSTGNLLNQTTTTTTTDQAAPVRPEIGLSE